MNAAFSDRSERDLSSLDTYAAPSSGAGASLDPLDGLANNVPGVPGEDYPILSEVPQSGFTCDGQVNGGTGSSVKKHISSNLTYVYQGYYADPEAECQVFHICTADGQGGLSKYSFLCPNGTIFNQNYFICDWWFNFDCAEAESLYGRNDEFAAETAAADEAVPLYAAPGGEGNLILVLRME